LESLAIGCGDASALLPTVLESEESEESKTGYVFIGGINTKYAAALMQSFSLSIDPV